MTIMMDTGSSGIDMASDNGVISSSGSRHQRRRKSCTAQQFHETLLQTLPVTPCASGTILPGALFQRTYPHVSMRHPVDTAARQ